MNFVFANHGSEFLLLGMLQLPEADGSQVSMNQDLWIGTPKGIKTSRKLKSSLARSTVPK